MTMMERSGHTLAAGGFAYPHTALVMLTIPGMPAPSSMPTGRKFPGLTGMGIVLKTVSERYRPAPGQKTFFHSRSSPTYELWGPSLIPDLPERIMKGEFVLPLYADLPGMPEHERRAIWGLMIYNEGKCRIIYDTYKRPGLTLTKICFR